MDRFVSFMANSFPLYFRAPALMALAWTFWGVNVLLFKRFGIDYCELLNFNRSSLLSPTQIIGSGIGMLAVIGGFCTMYAHQWPLDDVLLLPMLLFMVALGLLFAPINILHRSGRARLLQNMWRVLMPASTGVLFVEVVLGDVLTSTSKVLADLQVTGCVLLAHFMSESRHSHLHAPGQLEAVGSAPPVGDAEGGLFGRTAAPLLSLSTLLVLYAHESGCADSWMRPMVTSIPFLLRLRQCLVQYFATKDAFPHLVNGMKYISSLPVIWISAYTHHYPDSNAVQLRTAWILVVSFNSFFSFMWDVVMDWGLCRQGAKRFLLRETLVYAQEGPLPCRPESGGGGNSKSSRCCMHPCVYYLAIVSDFVLRILWSFKLSVHFQLSQEGVTFVLEVCEVFRRFVWLFFRLEWQCVRQASEPKTDKDQLDDQELQPLTHIRGSISQDADMEDSMVSSASSTSSSGELRARMTPPSLEAMGGSSKSLLMVPMSKKSKSPPSSSSSPRGSFSFGDGSNVIGKIITSRQSEKQTDR